MPLADFLHTIQFMRSGLAALGPACRARALSETAVNTALDAWFATQPQPLEHGAHLRALALWWHDHLDASHTISQDLNDADGAYIHGLMHRREPDDDNARYWVARVGAHPLYAVLEPMARTQIATWPDGASNFGDAFITACAAAPKRDDPRLRRLQAQEAAALAAHWLGEPLLAATNIFAATPGY